MFFKKKKKEKLLTNSVIDNLIHDIKIQGDLSKELNAEITAKLQLIESENNLSKNESALKSLLCYQIDNNLLLRKYLDAINLI